MMAFEEEIEALGSLSFSHHVRNGEKAAVCKPGGGSSPGTLLANITLISDLQPEIHEARMCVVAAPPLVCGLHGHPGSLGRHVCHSGLGVPLSSVGC